MKRTTAIAIAFLAGVVVALAIAYALAASGRPPGGSVGWLAAVLHPFLRLPGSAAGGVFAASIVFNGVYYAAAVAIAMRLGRGLLRIVATVVLIAILRAVLLLLFSTGMWLVRGEMSHTFNAPVHTFRERRTG